MTAVSAGGTTRRARRAPSELAAGVDTAETALAQAEGPGARPGWTAGALAFLHCIVAVFTVATLFRVGAIEKETKAGLDRSLRVLQRVEAGVEFHSERQRLLLGVRNEILKANQRLSLAEAYGFAEHVVRASEKYPALDPLLIVAVGIVESGYDAGAKSPANARGLYQIWPATGRLLARARGWSYSDELLFDPEKNTELAALYLDMLFAAYRDQQMVLAEYNGGPLNAGYFRAGSDRIALETRDYVRKVTSVHEGIKARLGEGPERVVLGVHQDPQRRGKTLAGVPDTSEREERFPRRASAPVVGQD